MDEADVECLACLKAIKPDDAYYPDVSGFLCAECAPTYAMLLDDDEACGFVDLQTCDPLPREERLAIYEAHIAAGGSPDDSMAQKP